MFCLAEMLLLTFVQYLMIVVMLQGEEEDFEENDVISLISDQEYSMH